jgi:hypothetical protein
MNWALTKDPKIFLIPPFKGAVSRDFRTFFIKQCPWDPDSQANFLILLRIRPDMINFRTQKSYKRCQWHLSERYRKKTIKQTLEIGQSCFWRKKYIFFGNNSKIPKIEYNHLIWTENYNFYFDKTSLDTSIFLKMKIRG